MVLLQPTRQDRQKTIVNATGPKTHDSDESVFVFQTACLCPNSCEKGDARQMRMTDQETCAGCLVVITDHGPRAEAAQVLGHELLVDSGEGRLEGLEEEQQKKEEEEVGEERERANTTHG